MYLVAFMVNVMVLYYLCICN